MDPTKKSAIQLLLGTLLASHVSDLVVLKSSRPLSKDVIFTSLLGDTEEKDPRDEDYAFEYSKLVIWDFILTEMKVPRTNADSLTRYSLDDFGLSACIHDIIFHGDDETILDNKSAEECIEKVHTHNLTTQSDTVSRSEFCTEVWHDQLDLIPLIKLAFNIFPSDEGIYVSMLPSRIRMSRTPPFRRSFIVTYVKDIVSGNADLRDLAFCFLLVSLYAIAVTQDRGLTPNSFLGRGIVKGLKTAFDTQEFPSCTVVEGGAGGGGGGSSPPASLVCDDSTVMVFDDVASVNGVYSYLRGGVSNLYWQNSSTFNATTTPAGESRIANGLRVVGALKIRTQYSTPKPSGHVKSFFEPVYAPEMYRYPPDGISTATLANASTFVQSRVLMPWDGSLFGSCADLNGTGTISGLNTAISCVGHAVVFPFNNSKADYERVIDDLAASDWISNITRSVVVETMLFHADSTMFTSLQVLFQIQAGGAVNVARVVTPFMFNDGLTSNALSYFVCGFIVLSLLVVLTRFIKTKFFGNALENLELPGIVDIGFVLMLIIPIVLRVLWMLAGDATSNDPLWQLDHFPRNYENVAELFTTSITADGFCSVFGVLLLVRFARYTSRCAPIVNTINRSLQLSIVLVVLTAAILLTFATSATVIFGDRQLGYQTVWKSSASLMLGFIGSFDFKPLVNEQYATGFIFFVVFILLVIIVFLSMFVAVFSDSFDDEQGDAFRAVHLKHILANNPNHGLSGSTGHVWQYHTLILHIRLYVVTYIARFKEGLLPKSTKSSPKKPSSSNVHAHIQQSDLEFAAVELQPFNRIPSSRDDAVERAILEKRYNYVDFNKAVASDLLAVLEPTFGNVPMRTRIESLASLMLLIDKYGHFSPDYVTTRSNTSSSTSLNAYIRHLFGGFDHDLIMTLLVMVPQNKFGMHGVPALEHAARKWKPWDANVSRRVPNVDDAAVMALERDILRRGSTQCDPNSSSTTTSVTSSTDNEMEEVEEVEDVEEEEGSEVDSNDNTYIPPTNVAIGTDDAPSEETTTTASTTPPPTSPKDDSLLNGDSVSTSDNFKDLCEYLSPLHRRVFLGLLACGTKEDYEVDVYLDEELFQSMVSERRFKKLFESSEYGKGLNTTDSDIISEENSITLWSVLTLRAWLKTRVTAKEKELKMLDAVPFIVKEFGTQCYGMNFSFEKKEALKKHARDMTFNRVCPFWGKSTTTVAHVAFSRLWFKSTLGHEGKPTLIEKLTIPLSGRSLFPPKKTMQLFPNMPGTGVNIHYFLKYCRDDPNSQQRQSFPQVFARHMGRASLFLSWITFTTLFTAFIIFGVLLLGSATVNNVHVSNSVRSSLAPPHGDSEVHDLQHIKEYLKSAVSTIWSGKTSNDNTAAKPLSDVNYFIGALRVRQVRVLSRPYQTCHAIFEEYLDVASDTTLNTTELNFYENRVKRDFSSLVAGRCYGAYDFGHLEDTTDMTTVSSFPLAILNTALKYQKTPQRAKSSFRAHDTTYPTSGYFVDIPFNSTTDEATFIIDQLTHSEWLDQQTRAVVIEFAVFNLNLNFYTHARFGFEVTAGGAMYPLQDLTSLSVVNNALVTPQFILTSVGYALIVVWYLRLLFGRGMGSITLIKVVKKWWDLAMLFMFIGSWLWGYTLIWSGVDSLHNNGQYPQEIELMGASTNNKATFESVLLFLVVIRLFVVLCLNRNIRLIFDTLQSAYNDLIVLLALFIICLLAFTVGAMLLFGYYSDGQYNFQNSFFDFLNTVSGGDSSYQTLSALRPQVALIFFTIFVITCLFVLFNMVIAVLTGAFRETKQRLYDPQPAEEVLTGSPHHSINKVEMRMGRRPMGIEMIQKVKWLRRRMGRNSEESTLAKRHGANVLSDVHSPPPALGTCADTQAETGCLTQLLTFNP